MCQPLAVRTVSVDRSDVRLLALKLMCEHGLGDWKFVFDQARARAGQCRYSRKEIGLSEPVVLGWSEAGVRNTVLHEIAHAIAYREYGDRGHGPYWRKVAHGIGCTGDRCWFESDDTPAVADAPWKGTCPAGHTTSRHQRPVRVHSCSQCSRRFDFRHVYAWTYYGKKTDPTNPRDIHPRYAAEYSRIAKIYA